MPIDPDTAQALLRHMTDTLGLPPAAPTTSTVPFAPQDRIAALQALHKQISAAPAIGPDPRLAQLGINGAGVTNAMPQDTVSPLGKLAFGNDYRNSVGDSDVATIIAHARQPNSPVALAPPMMPSGAIHGGEFVADSQLGANPAQNFTAPDGQSIADIAQKDLLLEKEFRNGFADPQYLQHKQQMADQEANARQLIAARAMQNKSMRQLEGNGVDPNTAALLTTMPQTQQNGLNIVQQRAIQGKDMGRLLAQGVDPNTAALLTQQGGGAAAGGQGGMFLNPMMAAAFPQVAEQARANQALGQRGQALAEEARHNKAGEDQAARALDLDAQHKETLARLQTLEAQMRQQGMAEEVRHNKAAEGQAAASLAQTGANAKVAQDIERQKMAQDRDIAENKLNMESTIAERQDTRDVQAARAQEMLRLMAIPGTSPQGAWEGALQKFPYTDREKTQQAQTLIQHGQAAATGGGNAAPDPHSALAIDALAQRMHLGDVQQPEQLLDAMAQQGVHDPQDIKALWGRLGGRITPEMLNREEENINPNSESFARQMIHGPLNPITGPSAATESIDNQRMKSLIDLRRALGLKSPYGYYGLEDENGNVDVNRAISAWSHPLIYAGRILPWNWSADNAQ